MNAYLRAEWKDGRWRVWVRILGREWEVTWAIPLLKKFLARATAAAEPEATWREPRGYRDD